MENKSALAVLVAGVLVASSVFFAPVNSLVDKVAQSFGVVAGDTFTNTVSFLSGYTIGAESNTSIDSYNCTSITYNAPSLAPNATATTGTTFTGVALGDNLSTTFATSTQGLTVNAYVNTANSSTVYLVNGTGGTVDLATTTIEICATAQ